MMHAANNIEITRNGETYSLRTEQWMKVSIGTAWDFFSSPRNLSSITPPELDFKILTALGDREIFDGMKIDYSVKPLFGIAFHWQTEICQVVKEKIFVDRQLKGPYKIWQHEHRFVEQGGGVLMTDKVDYKLPFGIFGRIMHQVLVKQKLENIFGFRKGSIDKIFRQ